MWPFYKLPSNAWNFKRIFDTKFWQSKEPFSHEVVDSFGNRVTIWQMPRSGMRIHAHKHTYAHDTHLIQGTVVVSGDREGRNGIPVTAPDSLFFDAGSEHHIKALSNDVIFIHTYKVGTAITEAN